MPISAQSAGTGGLNKKMTNLDIGVAINRSLLPADDMTQDLGATGATTKRWRNLCPATLRTGEAAGDTILFQARDVDGTSWKTFITLKADNAPSLVLNENTSLADGAGLIIGHPTQITASNTSELQVLGTSGADSSIVLARFSANNKPPSINLLKSRNISIGSNTIVLDNDVVGQLKFLPDDGADYSTIAAQFHAEVDDPSPAAGDIGMAFVWQQMPGAGGALAETMRLTAAGNLEVAGQVKITGGSPGLNKVLTSDADGLANWTLPAGGGFTDVGATIILTNINDDVGIGTAGPNAKCEVAGTPGASVGGFPSGQFHVTNPSASANANSVITGHNLNGGNKQLWYLGSTSGSNDAVALINRQNSSFHLGTNNINRFHIEPGGDIGVNQVNPLGQFHIDQSSTTGAKPVLYLDQADISEEMIEFNTTIGVGNAIEAIGAKTLTTTHFIKVTLPGGLTRYLPVGTIA